MTNDIKKICPRCESEEKQNKYGYTKKKNKDTDVWCMMCKAVYSFAKPKAKPKYSEEFKRESVQLYLEGNSGRAVGRLRKIGKNTIWSWLEKYKSTLPIAQENDVNAAEQDELYTFCKKNKIEST